MSVFHFKKFRIQQHENVFKVGTDAMLLGAYSTKAKKQPVNALDIGCGSGVLTVIMAFYSPTTKIVSVDINKMATDLTRKNIEINHIEATRVTILNESFLALNFSQKFDLIVSNPPYFSNSLKNTIEMKTLARHDDGLSIENLLKKIAEILSDRGDFWVIYPSETTKDLKKIGEEYGLYPSRIVTVFGKLDRKSRHIYQFKKVESNRCKVEELIIRDSNGKYTSEYIELTKHLHNRDLSSK